MALNVNDYITANRDFDLAVYGFDFDTVAWAGLVGILTLAITLGYTNEQTQELIDNNTAEKIGALEKHQLSGLEPLLNR